MNKNNNILMLGLTAVIAIGSPVLAQKKTINTRQSAPITAGTVIPNDPDVKIGKLANGLTYYIRKNTEPKKRAELYLANS
jgi:zinc protease